MVFPEQQQYFVHNLRLSSVGPGRVTGSNVVHDLTGLDLAMKLHYLKGVYFFSSQAVEGLTIMNMKEAMFYLLNDYYMTCGRIKRTESGRPFIRCNDCGVRFVEGVCDKSIDEWLEIEDDSLRNLLVYHRPIGPELSFSPLVYLQVTRFKCGGISLGMSWAHILGDAFSASDFIKSWGQYMASLKLNGSLTKIEKPKDPTQHVNEPLSAKQVNYVGDLWLTANNCKMETFSFYLSTTHLSSLQAKISGEADGRISKRRISPFESVCALIWQCIAKVRERFEPQIVTVCRKDPNYDNKVPSNSQIISSIKADFSVIEADNLKKLALLLADDDQSSLDERNKIEAAVERDKGLTDYIIYGTNLTFVNLEDANLYELELKGQKPKLAYYSIQGVGDEGAVLFLPGRSPKDSSIEDEGKERLVTITLPEGQVLKLKTELKRSGLVLASELE